jgi:7-carboxy-7-deazaguanine synthase
MEAVKPVAKTTAEPLGRLAEIFVTCQGEGPHVGKRHLFLRLAGCEVGCRFCDTPDALRGGASYEVRATEGDPARVLPNPAAAAVVAALVHDLAAAHAPLHAISVTGGEPLEQPDFLTALLPRLAPHAVLLETAGLHPRALERVIDHVAIVSMDLKMASVARTAPALEVHREFLAIALRREVYVKVVVSRELDLAEFDAGVAMVAAVAPAIPFVIQPETNRRRGLECPFEFLYDLQTRAARLGLADVRVIPQVHKYLVAP